MHYTNVRSISPVVDKTAGKSYTRIFGTAIARLFGCRHRKLSRPFTGGEQTYIACLTCGMRRAFDPEMWTPYGSFYAEKTREDFPKAAACLRERRRVVQSGRQVHWLNTPPSGLGV
jgi:hypothetical protein